MKSIKILLLAAVIICIGGTAGHAVTVNLVGFGDEDWGEGNSPGILGDRSDWAEVVEVENYATDSRTATSGNFQVFDVGPELWSKGIWLFGDPGYIEVNFTTPSDSLFVQFESDSNDGQADFYLDGQLVHSMNTNNGSWFAVVFSGLELGTHTLRVVAAGTVSPDHLSIDAMGSGAPDGGDDGGGTQTSTPCALDMSGAVVNFGHDGTTNTLYCSNIQFLETAFTIFWKLSLISGTWEIQGTGGTASGTGGLIDFSSATVEFSECLNMVIRDFLFLGQSFTACWSLDMTNGNFVLVGLGDGCADTGDDGQTNGRSSTVTVHVTDAGTGDDLSGATVMLLGTGQFTDVTDENGICTFRDVPYGAYDIEVIGPTGYVSSMRSETIDDPAENFLIVLSTILTSDQIRIVLTWFQVPEDLDAHLRVPSDSGISDSHVGYQLLDFGIAAVNYGSATSYPWATLDVDDVDGMGPETITIHQLVPGTYHYYVHLYQDPRTADQFDESLVRVPLRDSGARVEVIRGSTIIASYSIPTTGVGRIWYVFYMDGSSGGIVDINSIEQNLP